ncbi:hypothetical protein [Lentilitoribacter sp. Alg239-R112]|uniref:hypothetical protein n=1 Tax=Lentilitoribacter sp. Alg239-R112 TaxID=2305987 RepID=UPI0013A6D929|nr:hypothetical protein [Lentilitoribacter sp. Alg239-R112]
MSNLSKLTLTTTTPNQPLTPLARKRIKLLRKLDQQLLAAEAEKDGSEFTEEVKRWVKNVQTGEKELITQSRTVKKWWWANEHGALVLTLKDGNKIIPLDDNHKSVEVGGIEDLASTIETVRAAVIAGELDQQLEKLIAERKPFGKNKKPTAQHTSKTTKSS